MLNPRISAILLAAGMAVAGVTGCSQSSTPEPAPAPRGASESEPDPAPALSATEKSDLRQAITEQVSLALQEQADTLGKQTAEALKKQSAALQEQAGRMMEDKLDELKQETAAALQKELDAITQEATAQLQAELKSVTREATQTFRQEAETLRKETRSLLDENIDVVRRLTAQATNVTSSLDVQSALKRAKNLAQEQKYADALMLLGKISSQDLSPEQRTELDQTRSAIEKNASENAGSEAGKVIRNLFDRPE